MNLYQTAKYILSVAKAQPNVGLAYEGDIYELNERQDIAYPAVAVTQATHAENGEWRGYGFNIFYVDRLTADKGNRLEIQSIAIEALSNIYKVLIESGFETQAEIRYHSFDERFDAECAGAYMEVVFQSQESLCPDGMMPYIPGSDINPSWFNPDDYYTSAQTDDRIAKAIEEAELSGITLDDYWTSAQTQTAINDAVSSITVSGVTRAELDEAIAAETARTESTYLKEHQSLEGYATEQWVEDKHYLTEHQSLDDYYTSAQTDNKISEVMAAETARTEQTYLKEHQSLADYYTSAQTDSKISETMAAETARTEQTYLKEHQSLDGYATEEWVNEQGFLKEHQSLVDYYTSAQTDSKISEAMAAETARTEQTYLKEHQSLDNYYTKAQVDSAITNAVDTESSRTDTAISNAIASETARTESTYLKEHQSLADYYTSAQTNNSINTAMQSETARTESTYLKEHQSLADYYTSAQTNSAIATAMAAETARTESTYLKEHQSLADYYTSAQTDNIMAAETARTEATYLKEHQSLANYYTSAQTDSAISTAIQTETARTEQAYTKKPVVLYEYDGNNPITGQAGNLLESPSWHTLTGVDLSGFKKVKVFINPSKHSVGLSTNNITPALVFEVALEPLSLTADVQYYSGGSMAPCLNNDNRSYTAAVLIGKTINDEWQIAMKTVSLYGTSSTNVTDSHIYRIEGLYE